MIGTNNSSGAWLASFVLAVAAGVVVAIIVGEGRFSRFGNGSNGSNAPGNSESTEERESRPHLADPAPVLERYWLALNQRTYENAWNSLSSSFKTRNHAGDFGEYVRDQMGMKVCSVATRDVVTEYTNDRGALVEATVVFRAGKTCRESREYFRFYMVVSESGEWLIDRVVRR